MKLGLLAVSILLAQAIVPASPLSAADAVTFQIDAAHDGRTSFDNGFAPPLKRIWARKLDGAISYPVIANGLVFVTIAITGTQSCEFVALDLGTGQTVWEKVLGSMSDVAYDNGQVFAVNAHGVVQAFVADNSGAQRWAVQLPVQWAYGTTPIAYSGRLYVSGGGNGGTLYALDEATGTLDWTAPLPTFESAVPTAGDGGIYETVTGTYVKLSPDTGKLIWGINRYFEGGTSFVAPYYDKRLYVRDIGNGDVVVQTHKGVMLGPLDTSQTVAFWQSATGDSYELALRSGTLYSVDLGTGKSYWNFSGDGQLSSAPIVINDVVAIGSLSGTVFVLDAATGAQLWSANVGAPILGGDGNSSPLSGLGAGEDTLIVPGTNRIAAYMMKH